MLKCNACKHEFVAKIENHYISRDNTDMGVLSSLTRIEEPATFDTFDCPVCGCQVIVQERKRYLSRTHENSFMELLTEDHDGKRV